MNDQKWDYRINCLMQPVGTWEHMQNVAMLEAAGSDGWELVSVDRLIAYFKRPRSDTLDPSP